MTKRESIKYAMFATAIIAALAFAVQGVHTVYAIDETAAPKATAHEVESHETYYVHRLAPHHSSDEEMFSDWRSDPQAFVAWMRNENGDYLDYHRTKTEDQQIADGGFYGPNCEIEYSIYGGDMYWFVDDELMHYDSTEKNFYRLDPHGNETFVASIHKAELAPDAIYHWYYQHSDGYIYNTGLYELTFDGNSADNPGVVHLWHYNAYEGISEEILSFETSESVEFYPDNVSYDPSKCLLVVGGKLVEASKDGLRDITETTTE